MVLPTDLRQFKWVNDSYGHQAGDKVLQETARILLDSTPDDTLVARLSGSEFGLLIHGDEEKSANRLVESINNHLFQCHYPLQTLLS